MDPQPSGRERACHVCDPRLTSACLIRICVRLRRHDDSPREQSPDPVGPSTRVPQIAINAAVGGEHNDVRYYRRRMLQGRREELQPEWWRDPPSSAPSSALLAVLK
jgi:hypothetical protein